ncbi:MAG: patatin-like phospholipase family protein [Desulfarculus sp.]|nr:patatin-like phospholipase family protein [Desulfarculus sp.]
MPRLPRRKYPPPPALLMACLVILGLALGAGNVQAGEGQKAAPPAPGRLKVGLALSGGGARGLAHIGVLKVIEELGIPVDMVAGTSMGSIVGGLYCAGYTPAQIEEIVAKVDWKESFSSQPERRLLRFDQKDENRKYLFEVGLGEGTVHLPAGLISGYKLTALLTRLCLPVAHVDDFDRLPIPFRAVATDLTNGEAVVLARGNLAQAMRASMSIPSVFPAYELEGRLLVDGGVVQNLPVRTVRDMGADIVIAVNVSTPLKDRAHLRDFVDVMDQTLSLHMIRATLEDARLADLVIAPDLTKISNADFAKGQEISEIGLAAARQAAPRLQALATGRGVQLAQRPRPGVEPVRDIVVGKVSMIGPRVYQAEVKRLAPFQPGQKISSQDLDQAVQKLYGLGTLENVAYEVIPGQEGRSEVRFNLREKPLGDMVTRLGLRLGVNSERADALEAHLNLRRNNLFYGGAYGEADVYMGRVYGVGGRLMLPNKPWEGLFFSPEIGYLSRLYDVYANQSIKAQYLRQTTSLALEAGQYLGTLGELRLGYLYQVETISTRVATIALPEGTDTAAGPRLSLRLDNLDRDPYATRGFRSEITAFRSMKSLYSTRDFMRLTWEAKVALALTDRQTLVPNWSLGTSLDSGAPLAQVMFLGGYPGLWGYANDEFFGQELLRAQLLHRYKLTPSLYWQTAVNAGKVSDSVENSLAKLDDLRWGGGAGLAYDTPLGPAEVTVGLGEAGRLNLYFYFGYGF